MLYWQGGGKETDGVGPASPCRCCFITWTGNSSLKGGRRSGPREKEKKKITTRWPTKRAGDVSPGEKRKEMEGNKRETVGGGAAAAAAVEGFLNNGQARFLLCLTL